MVGRKRHKRWRETRAENGNATRNKERNERLMLVLSVYGKYRMEACVVIGYAEIDVGQFLLYDICPMSKELPIPKYFWRHLKY